MTDKEKAKWFPCLPNETAGLDALETPACDWKPDVLMND